MPNRLKGRQPGDKLKWNYMDGGVSSEDEEKGEEQEGEWGLIQDEKEGEGDEKEEEEKRVQYSLNLEDDLQNKGGRTAPAMHNFFQHEDIAQDEQQEQEVGEDVHVQYWPSFDDYVPYRMVQPDPVEVPEVQPAQYYPQHENMMPYKGVQYQQQGEKKEQCEQYYLLHENTTQNQGVQNGQNQEEKEEVVAVQYWPDVLADMQPVMVRPNEVPRVKNEQPQ